MVIGKLKDNSISLNAMHCIKPTDEFKMRLADTILEILKDKKRLLPQSGITSDNENIRELAELTPILYLEINQS